MYLSKVCALIIRQLLPTRKLHHYEVRMNDSSCLTAPTKFYICECYLLSSTSWSWFVEAHSERPTQTNGRYFWTRLSIMYKFSSTENSYQLNAMKVRCCVNAYAYTLSICAGFTCDTCTHCACVGCLLLLLLLPLLLLPLRRRCRHTHCCCCCCSCCVFLLRMFYQHGKWVEKTGESPPRVWRCTLCSMHTLTHTNKHRNTLRYIPLRFTLSLSLCVCPPACSHVVVVYFFPSLFTRCAALHGLCWARQLLFSQLRDRQKANNNTFMRSPSRSSIHLLALLMSLSLSLDDRASCVPVCLLLRRTLYSAYVRISMCLFSILFFLERIPTFPSQDEVGYACLFRACNDLFYFDSRKLWTATTTPVAAYNITQHRERESLFNQWHANVEYEDDFSWNYCDVYFLTNSFLKCLLFVSWCCYCFWCRHFSNWTRKYFYWIFCCTIGLLI